MVCLGNICRSPLAEGLLQYKASKAGFDWLVESAGTSGYHIGEQPHVLSQKLALLNGFDISGQQCRQFVKQDMLRFNRIYVMDTDNYAEVKRISGNLWDEEKVKLMLDILYPGEKQNIPDPWYGTEKDYHFVFNLLNMACEKIIETYGELKIKSE